ncbi:NADPH:quinone oxidoreductase family protein [Robiginitalea marina]|uniref:NADPH:quinone oxidoreductase family protein n=1 Tax=Robiginitalea marina TaxID=2954105 RepID=A0ABT1B2E0_9FLAO|nr:NADPH:quinone oxidoreductase family protein [Robiginitalea marina]MCO5726015.1 NADPH:quinone oxidoreductase family protein [Robiginitalea marina]
MKAIRCNAYGPPSGLVLETVADLRPGENEVLVQVKACGINFPDTLIIRGLYQIKPELPFTPGSDVAGVVRAVGAGVRHVGPGDAVIGFVAHGGLAEEVLVPAGACFPKPPEMDFPVAASFMMAYGTAYHALKDRGHLKPGETLLVLGASGGVGLAAVELGKRMGATVIAAASTPEKLALCREYGADHTVQYTETDLKTALKELTGSRGVDVVLDPVGGPYSEPAFRAIAWGGRLLVVGFAAGEIPKIPLNLPLLKGASLVGVFWGQFAMTHPGENLANTRELMAWYAGGKLSPHLHEVFALEDAPKAIEALMQREVKGKVVVQVG